MAETIFDIARRFQRKIEEDVDYSNRFAARTRENFLANDGVSSEMLQNRLDERQFQFDLVDLNQNFNSDLALSRLESQRALDIFGPNAALEDQQRLLDRRRTQYELDTFEEDAELDRRRREADLIEQETRLEKITHERKYNGYMDQIVAEGLDKDPLMKFERLYELTRNDSANVRARVDADLLSEMEDETQALNKWYKVLETPRGEPGSTQSIKWEAAVRSFVISFNRSDTELFELAIAKGVIDEDNIPVEFLRFITGEDTVNQEQLLDDGGDIQPDSPIDDGGLSTDTTVVRTEPVIEQQNPIVEEPPVISEEVIPSNVQDVAPPESPSSLPLSVKNKVFNILDVPLSDLSDIPLAKEAILKYLNQDIENLTDREVDQLLEKIKEIDNEVDFSGRSDERLDDLGDLEVERDRLLEVAISLNNDEDVTPEEISRLALFLLNNEDQLTDRVKKFMLDSLKKYNAERASE